MRTLKEAFVSQMHTSRRRKIPFLLTFEEWLKIWKDSGHLSKRGRGAGKYHMARPGDTGPYSIDNVVIKSCEANCSEASLGKPKPPFSDEHCRKISEMARGRKRKPHSKATKLKMRLAKLGKKVSLESRRRMSEAKRGSHPNVSKKVRKERANLLTKRNKSPEMRAKVSAGLKGTTVWKTRTRDKFGHFI
jgi:hypothetical protein